VERVIDLSLKGTMQKESALGRNSIFQLLNKHLTLVETKFTKFKLTERVSLTGKV
jgi:hypothetical protein